MSSFPSLRRWDRGTWLAYFQAELDKLQRSLPEGADSFSPRRPTKQILDVAQQIADSLKQEALPLPLVVAGSDGSLEIRWRLKLRELSFFVSPQAVEFLQVQGKGPIEEGTLKDPTHAQTLAKWLLAA
ncbi:MAG: hypothetical protein ACREQI_00790 [Candidatus Binataceae bacterium]